jgi:hypothetical protein
MTDRPSSHPAPGSQRARLHIDGVRTPVLTRVARRRETGMTCVQELPFLRLESAVTDDQGRRARIARVALSVEKDMPKLVIELAYDDHDDDFPSGPPAVPYGTIVVAPSHDGIDTLPGAPAPTELAAELDSLPAVFRADPMDSLREPPVTLVELARAWWNELAASLRELERTVSGALAPAPRLA